MKEKRTIFWEITIACTILLGFSTVVKHLGGLPLLGEHGFTLVVGLQLYLPYIIFWCKREKPPDFGLTLQKCRTEFKAVGLICLVAFPLFALGHHFYQTLFFQRNFHFALPGDVGEMVVVQLLLVALPEELFYRGYLQERLRILLPDKRTILGASVGWSIVVASAIFALGHFVGEYNFLRLGPFFPGLIFGFLRARSGTILGATLFHGFSNIWSAFLFASYAP